MCLVGGISADHQLGTELLKKSVPRHSKPTLAYALLLPQSAAFGVAVAMHGLYSL